MSAPLNASPGDRIRVVTASAQYEGILMPTVSLTSSDVTTIKLDTGYNMGIVSSSIQKITVLEPYKKPVSKTVHVSSDVTLPKVAILSTGGTISSKVDYRTGGTYADYTADDFVAMCPEIQASAQLISNKIMAVMSEDVAWQEWNAMASAILPYLLDKSVSGVVLTCGTDTLHYISTALSFFLKNINKPVVITAAQRSIDRGSSDAFMNLSCAVHTAAKSAIPAVIVCMHATSNDDSCMLIRGTKVRKMHTSRRDSFRPINDQPLGFVWPSGKLELSDSAKQIIMPAVEPSLDAQYESAVAQILVHPGLDPEIIDYYISKGCKGIVLSATALGHVCATGAYSLMPGIHRAVEKNIPIVIASQTIYGKTHPYVYTNLRKLSIGEGCIFAHDMLSEVAYVKLGYALGHAKTIEQVKEIMHKNIAGELNPRHSEKDFLV